MEQLLLDGFEPTKEDLYLRAINLPLEKKIENAILFLKIHEPTALNYKDYGYSLCFSGGKDSAVIHISYLLNKYEPREIGPPITK